MTMTRARDTRHAALNSQQLFRQKPGTRNPNQAGFTPPLASSQQPNSAQRQIQADRSDAARLLQILHQGGSYAHLWTDAGNQSFWFTAASPNCPRFKQQTERVLYRQWARHNVFFSVHPLWRVPPHNSSGNGNPRYISSQLPYIAAVNTLFAEYDGKDYVRLPEYMTHLPRGFAKLSDIEQRKSIRSAQEKTFYAKPERYKARVRTHIESLAVPPSVIIDSGGGYHCYWLLDETQPVDDTNRTDIQSTQHSWVRMVGADVGASDLRRVLRVPGTTNRKPRFGTNPPRVTFVNADFDQRYRYAELEEMTNDWLYENKSYWSISDRALHRGSAPAPAQHYRPVSLGLPLGDAEEGDSEVTSRFWSDEELVRRRFNRQQSLVDLLVKHGYQVCFTNDSMTRLSRPGRPKQNSSVIVFPGRDEETPELSIHFSTNDDLYSEEYIHPRTKQVKRRAYDAYSVFAFLEHDGNWHRARRAAQRQLAM